MIKDDEGILREGPAVGLELLILREEEAMPERAMEETAAAVKRPMRSPEPAPHSVVRAPAPVWDAAGAHAPDAPSAVLAIQRAAGNQAVMRMLDAQRPGHPLAGPSTAVQRSSENELDDEDDVQRAAAALHEPSDEAIRSAAAEGVRTPSTTLPHLDRIQASFGRHSIAHVQAHVGPEAARASRAMNALAYASGNHVVFGATPDLRTAAHEAAHIVQQQAGVQLSGGIGRAGDPYERHADAVADAVVAGQSAETLFVPLDSPRSPSRRDILPLQRSLGCRASKQLWAAASRSPVIQRLITIEYNDKGEEWGKGFRAQEAASLLVDDYGVPETWRLIDQLTSFSTLKSFSEKKGTIFWDIEELINVLADHGVPVESVADQAYDTKEMKRQRHQSNFANAYVVIDRPADRPTVDRPADRPTEKFGPVESGQVGNSIYSEVPDTKPALRDAVKRSQSDSEAGLLHSIHHYLLDEGNTTLEFLRTHTPDIYIRIVSNMGPCEGCKSRIDLFRKIFKKKTGYGDDKLVIDVYYDYKDTSKEYGWARDETAKTGLYKVTMGNSYSGEMYRHKIK